MLFDVLVRFCAWNIGLKVDNVKAYLQIAVSPTEYDYSWCLWYDDVKKKDLELAKYCFTQVILGVNLFAISP